MSDVTVTVTIEVKKPTGSESRSYSKSISGQPVRGIDSRLMRKIDCARCVGTGVIEDVSIPLFTTERCDMCNGNGTLSVEVNLAHAVLELLGFDMEGIDAEEES